MLAAALRPCLLSRPWPPQSPSLQLHSTSNSLLHEISSPLVVSENGEKKSWFSRAPEHSKVLGFLWYLVELKGYPLPDSPPGLWL